jgi:peptidoglycan/LPS O-acetylase OafA/YrhL
VTTESNNFGVLRLCLAGAVIVGHASEMVDGNRAREPLWMLTNTISLGELAVAGFFLLSGYLITASIMRSNDLKAYAMARMLRIYPAFGLAYLISVFILGPLVEARVWDHLPTTLLYLLFLQPPISYPGQFPGLVHYPYLNGAMWTIAYEFRCYILIAMLWQIGVLQRRRVIVSLTLVAIAGTIISSASRVHAELDVLSDLGRPLWITGSLYEGLKFSAAFLFGSSTYLYRDYVLPRLSGLLATLSVLIAAVLIINHPHVAQAALIVFGGIALFWLALKARLGMVQRINGKWDISYGTYLYGAPIATYIRWVWPEFTPFELGSVTLVLSLACGCASWWGLERWIKVRRKNSGPDRPALNPIDAANPVAIPIMYSGRT